MKKMENTQTKINKLVRYNAKGDYQERYRLLYEVFDNRKEINSKLLYQYARDKGVIKKSMSRIEYICKELGEEELLYDIAFELFVEKGDVVATK